YALTARAPSQRYYEALNQDAMIFKATMEPYNTWCSRGCRIYLLPLPFDPLTDLPIYLFLLTH
ncbi:hypothetical protein RYX45_25920, partial [Alkalihalophilus pseudofirmus]